MTARPRPAVIYWDASALLSALFLDAHSERAHEAARLQGAHLMSTLAFAEVRAVIARRRRDRLLPRSLAESALETVRTGPWRRILLSPRWDAIKDLADRWPLRGVDLWHLALAKAVREDRPDAQMLTFDDRLLTAARGEGLAR